MSIVKFENEKGSIQTPLPSAAPARQKVFDGKLKYAAKVDLPSTASSDTIIFTTDTKEFYVGNGLRGGLSQFNAIEVFSSVTNFPEKGVESKIYLDQGAAALYFYAGGRFREVGTGEGIQPEGFRDVRIGDLALLETNDKASVVSALNEIFRRTEGLSQEGLSDEIEAVRAEALDATGRLGVSVNGLTSDVSALRTRVGSVETTAQEAVTNIGILSSSVSSNRTRIQDVELETANAKRIAEDTAREFAALEDLVNGLDLSRLEDVDALAANIGTLSSLETNTKSSLVASVNELRAAIIALQEDEGVDLSPLEGRVTANENLASDLSERMRDVESFIRDMPVPSSIVTRTELRQELDNISVPSITGLATEQFVTNKIAELDIPGEVDLSDYVQRSELTSIQDSVTSLEDAIDNIAVGGNVDLTSYAKSVDVYTKTEVDALIPAPVSLDGLVTREELNSAIEGIEPQAGEVDLTGYATEAFVAQQVANIVIPDTSNFATQSDITTAISNIQIPTVPSDLVTQAQLDAAIAGVESGEVDLTGYARSESVYTKSEVDALIPAPVNVSTLATKAELQDVQDAVDAIIIPAPVDTSDFVQTDAFNVVRDSAAASAAILNDMIIISDAEKQMYDSYESTIANLTNNVIPALLSRITVLEAFHTNSGGGEGSIDPEPGEGEGGENQSENLWEYEFIVGPGAIDYTLGEDEPNGVFPYVLGETEDVYAEGKLFLYWLGYTSIPQIEPVLVESIGVDPEGMSSQVPHKSYYYDNYNLFFSMGDVSRSRYRLVMKR